MKLNPRSYQTEAYNKTREAFLNGHKHICIAMSGGAGKSLLCKMILDSAAKKGSKIGFFSFRKSLTDQIKKYNIPDCDVGTLQKFGKKETELYDLCIFDEKDYHDTKLKNNIKSKRSITLSGFPTDANGNVLDYDYIVEAIQFPELVKQGYAKEVKVLSISNADTSTLKKQGDGFNVKQSFELMEKAKVKRNILEVYKKYCIDRKTLLFAVDTNHAESLKKEFIEAGIKCDTVHSKKSSKENDNVMKDFEDNKIDLIINVVMISIGVDIPCINTILFARPMASVPLFMQCVWRGTRKFNNDYCLVIDCAEVLKRTDFHPMQRLDLTKTKQDKGVVKCPKCQNKMKLINRKIEPIDQYEYKVVSTYICDCGHTLEQETYKIINRELCEDGTHFFEPQGGLQYKQDNKAINFNLVCKCGYEKKFREMLLTDDELKEVKLHDALNNGATWEDVKTILLKCCKDNGYHHRYSIRLIDSLKAKKHTPKSAIESIKTILKQNKKISALMYI